VTLTPGADASAPSRERAAFQAMLASGALIALKLVLALVTGSVAVLAEAAHSASDLLASIVAAIAVRGEDRAGGPEVQAGALEGVFVLGAAAVIVFATIRRLGNPVEEPVVALTGMAVATAVAAAVGARIGTVARRTGSRALAADAEHLRDAAATSALVVVALLLVELTDLPIFDSLTALVIAAVIAREGIGLLLGVRPGRDEPEPAEVAAVAAALADGPSEVIGYRRPRARTAGGIRRLDVDVTLRRDVPAAREDEIHAALQDTLGARLPGVRVVVTLGPPSGGGWDRRGRRDAGGNARR
jgi:cation diffusion facilitator family transporter